MNDRFSGYVDDARVYSIALSDDEITKIYNNEGGDMGLVADFNAPSITDDTNISVNLKFLQFEEPVVVTGLLQSDLNVTKVQIYLNGHGDGNFRSICIHSPIQLRLIYHSIPGRVSTIWKMLYLQIYSIGSSISGSQI